jgi:hypothetical protein
MSSDPSGPAQPPEPPEESWLIDFFEEGDTRENALTEEEPVAVPESRPRSPRRGPSLQGRGRAARLALLVVAILAVTIVITLSLSGGNQASADNAYLSKLAGPALDSQSVGAALEKLLSSTPTSMKSLESSLSQLLGRQQQDLSETEAISPPPRLRDEQQQAVSAMQFRVGGLSGLLSGFQEASARPAEANWATQLSLQADGLITSDVIWRDLFVTPTSAQVSADGDHTTTVPASTFVPNSDITAPQAMATVLEVAQGHASPSSPSTAASSLLKLGVRSAAVKAWQQRLNQWIAHQTGMTKLKVTGVFDAATQTATEAMQTAAKITVDGVVGPDTERALTTLLGQA